MKALVTASLSEHIKLFQLIKEQLSPQIATCAVRLTQALQAGGKILVCGNGGSAADAQHFAAELVGRFETERQGLPALALTTDSSCLTAIANDYGYEALFSRQVEALASPEDVVFGISTSGQSENVLRAVQQAKQIGCLTVALCGRDGGAISQNADLAIVVPAERTARIQEVHIAVIHILCEIIESHYSHQKDEA